jgi:acetyl esterase/lipase
MEVAPASDNAAMNRSIKRHSVALLALIAFVALLAVQPPRADAASPFRLPILNLFPAPKPKPKPVPVKVIQPVQAPISADPAGPARGTIIMVHAGGWAGHDGHAQNLLLKSPGELFLARGWRVVSIDYNEGALGLQDVLDAVGFELLRKSSDGPLCIYGESSGAHLALVAASRLRAIDCVIGLGTPTDLAFYNAEAAVSSDARLPLVAGQIKRFFGVTPEDTAPWNLVNLAPTIHADVLLVHEADDEVVSGAHAARFQGARPTTQVIELEPGDRDNPADDFMHGTLSDVGRAHYMSGLGSFADREVAARDAERNAARTGCAQVTRSIAQAGLAALQNGLRCLAGKDAEARRTGIGSWRQTSVKLRGEINAARVWANLRATKSGLRALVAAGTRRAKVTVQAGDRSRVILQAMRLGRAARLTAAK